MLGMYQCISDPALSKPGTEVTPELVQPIRPSPRAVLGFSQGDRSGNVFGDEEMFCPYGFRKILLA